MGQLERHKIQAEIAKLKEDVLKSRLDREKAKKDLEKYSISFRLEVIRTIGAVGTFIVAAVALFTLGWNVYTYRTESDRRVSEHVSSILRDLDKSAPVRTAAIVSLTPYVNDPVVGLSVLDALTHMVVVEDDFEVQNTIVRTIEAAAKGAIQPLEVLRAQTISELEPTFDDIAKLDADFASTHNGSFLERRQKIEQQVKAKQHGLILIAMALRDLTCTRPSAKACPANFSGFPLKNMDFVGTRGGLLVGGRFSEAILWGADLFGIDLTGADFTEAWLNEANLSHATLTDAVFKNSHVERVEKNKAAGLPARFDQADLKHAVFFGACLGGADFSGALNLEVDQFKDAFAQGAIFDPSFAEKLKAAGNIKSSPKCRTY